MLCRKCLQCIRQRNTPVMIRNGNDIDLTNKLVVVDLVGTLPPKIGYRSIDTSVAIPAGLQRPCICTVKRQAAELKRGDPECLTLIALTILHEH